MIGKNRSQKAFSAAESVAHVWIPQAGDRPTDKKKAKTNRWYLCWEGASRPRRLPLPLSSSFANHFSPIRASSSSVFVASPYQEVVHSR
ncbi:unnamed protein product [Caenorhabditis auriculariae]|uniref:Uncharacterized protein n=1 Tax=Caenorhabditis auriculariae TaxID=2777116 RepID=A0A8S1HJF8_9PELO|nr:unnamed protein product [Caenorhabditis auriculariae]